ncbi:MAG TPA: hypothetical protein VFS39_06950 [Nitrospira sp.]|nr:hypothetical protein [Nitrospira sp.]
MRPAMMLLPLAFVSAMWGGAVSANEPSEQRIELAIRDSTYVKTKTTPIRMELPVTIVIRNEDTIRHGFTSSLLKGVALEGQGEGIDFYGRGIEGVHIEPGRTVLLRMIVPTQGSFSFHCDLHSEMQGEVYLLEVPIA